MRRMIIALLFLAVAASAGEFSYMLSRDRHTVISGNMNVDHVVRLNERLGPPYLWASRNGKEYLIRDAATLAEAHAAFTDSDALHAESERLRKRMRPVEELENDLEEKMDRLSDELSDREDLTQAERRWMKRELEELERRIEPVQRQLRALEEEEERLDQREEAVTAIAEKKLRDIVDRAVASGAARPVK